MSAAVRRRALLLRLEEHLSSRKSNAHRWCTRAHGRARAAPAEAQALSARCLYYPLEGHALHL